jgi:hypothetical protein
MSQRRYDITETYTVIVCVSSINAVMSADGNLTYLATCHVTSEIIKVEEGTHTHKQKNTSDIKTLTVTISGD